MEVRLELGPVGILATDDEPVPDTYLELGKQSLGATDFPSKRALRDHIEAYMRSWNNSPTPFAWTKPAQAIIKSHRRMLKRISTAVH